MAASAVAPIDVSSNLFITPHARLIYNDYDADGYTETGSLGFSAAVNPDSVSRLTGTISARIQSVHENIDGNGTALIPELTLGVVGDLMDDDANATANFVGGGTTFAVTGTQKEDIGAFVGVGLALNNPAWVASVSYEADIRSDYLSHTASAEFRLRF